MYINKIKQIKSIGSFVNFQPPLDLEFRKNNLVYAENGSGKTTFCTILRSLKQNEPRLLIEKKTLNQENQPFCIIETEQGNFQFENGFWKLRGQVLTQNLNSDIIIFDENFVNENIFLTSQHTLDHKKKLFQIIFGKEGQKKDRVIKEEELLNSNYREEVRLKLKTINFDDFIKPKVYDQNLVELEKKKLELEEKLKNLTNAEEIQKSPVLDKIENITVNCDFEKIKNILFEQLDDTAHKEAKNKVEEYIEKYFENESEARQFIKIGVKNTTDKCPFCHREISEFSELIEIYRNFYNEQLIQKEAEINKQIKTLEILNFDSILRPIRQTTEENGKRLENWKQFNDLKSLALPILEFPDFQDLIKNLIGELKEKLNNFSYKPEETGSLEEKINTFNQKISEYLAQVKAVNEAILNFKISLKTEEKPKIEIELKQIEDYIYSVESKGEIEKFLKRKEAIQKLKDKLQKEQENLGKKYSERINFYLNEFFPSCHFQIKNIEGKAKGTAKEAFTEIYVNFLGLDLDLSSSKEGEANFKNTFSGGEKNALALAFFLAMMEKVENKKQKIIVFDDPILSTDEPRIRATANLLFEISNNFGQVFILTHKQNFVEDLENCFRKESNFFKINKTSDGSVIEPLDVASFRVHIHQNRVKRLKKESDEFEVEDGKNPFNDLRKCLEFVIDAKYFLKKEAFCSEKPKNIETFSSLNNEFIESLGLAEDTKKSLLDIRSLTSEESHNRDQTIISRGDLAVRNELKKGLALLEKI